MGYNHRWQEIPESVWNKEQQQLKMNMKENLITYILLHYIEVQNCKLKWCITN